MSGFFDRVLVIACVWLMCGALLAGCSALETLIFQVLFRFLHFSSLNVFLTFFVVQAIEMWTTDGRGWIRV